MNNYPIPNQNQSAVKGKGLFLGGMILAILRFVIFFFSVIENLDDAVFTLFLQLVFTAGAVLLFVAYDKIKSNPVLFKAAAITAGAYYLLELLNRLAEIDIISAALGSITPVSYVFASVLETDSEPFWVLAKLAMATLFGLTFANEMVQGKLTKAIKIMGMILGGLSALFTVIYFFATIEALEYFEQYLQLILPGALYGAAVALMSFGCALFVPSKETAPAAAPQQPYGAPQQQNYYDPNQQPYGAPQQQNYYDPNQQPYGAPQQPYGAPQQPYGAPQQPYGAPQQPYGAPQQQNYYDPNQQQGYYNPNQNNNNQY